MENVIGQRIKYIRINSGMNQKELATKLRIANSTMSQYESGQRIPSDDLKLKIAEIFNVTIDYLLGRTDDPTPIRDVNQDLYDEHDYSKELEDFIKDNEISAAFQDYGSWTEEEKRNLLNFVKGQKALKELNKK